MNTNVVQSSPVQGLRLLQVGLQNAADYVGQRAAALDGWLNRRQVDALARADLMALSDRELRDIGMSRGSIPYALPAALGTDGDVASWPVR